MRRRFTGAVIYPKWKKRSTSPSGSSLAARSRPIKRARSIWRKSVSPTRALFARECRKNGVDNLWAIFGEARRDAAGDGVVDFAFAGHIDVVPPGDAAWTSDPFVAVERDGFLFGRGAADMKTSVAAMIVACRRLAATMKNSAASLAVILTSDEEGDAKDGVAHIVATLRARKIRLRDCLLGEPTSRPRFRRRD